MSALFKAAPARGEDLSETPFPRVLADLWTRRATGTLCLRLQAIEKRIVFCNGAPVFAESNIAEESIGRFLVERAVISEGTHFKALQKTVSSGRKMGEVLLALSAITPHELFQNLRRCFGKCILGAFAWKTGTFSFDHNPPDLDGVFPLEAERTTYGNRRTE
jgi:hypothetical protein